MSAGAVPASQRTRHAPARRGEPPAAADARARSPLAGLGWHGPADLPVPDLDRAWRAYVRRFDLEHTFRFLKQTLNWTLPRGRHPEQADRWTWLVVLASTQLRLARPLVADKRWPGERPLPAERLTPARVRRAFSALLPTLGSPAKAPQPCARSPGRPKASAPAALRAPRYPAVTTAAITAALTTA
jgi:hypothetical protein